MYAIYCLRIILASINERTNFENKALGEGIIAIIYLFIVYHPISQLVYIHDGSCTLYYEK